MELSVRYRPAPWLRNGLVVAVVVSVVAVWVSYVHQRNSSAAFARYHADYQRHGGQFVDPASLADASDNDRIWFIIATFLAVAVWSVLFPVLMLWRYRLRLDADGLCWRPVHGLRWRGPVPRTHVVSMTPDARVRQVRLFGSLFARPVVGIVRKLGGFEATVLYLRTDAGQRMGRLSTLDLPDPPPAEARSCLVVPGPVLATNPDFVKRLRAWILP